MATSVSSSLAPLLFFAARIWGLFVAALVVSWALVFKPSFLPSIYLSRRLHLCSSPSFANGDWFHSHQWRSNFGTQMVAWFKGFQEISAFVSARTGFGFLHSWMGLICISLFGAQWLMGFMSFWHRGEARSVRMRVLPWHVFLGLYTYGLAVATAETGTARKDYIPANKQRCSQALLRIHGCQWFRTEFSFTEWHCNISRSFSQVSGRTHVP
ncbi:CYTOCHROME B561-RELATED [Salix viminalis]|uniref:CYTOCHROME B561-RELATED n=1 Tax=Salix viminalis TaxID=40686 RepID=A0A9Q0Z4K6_SALVM|nr:CYTOCHROME B561-RELATED [Salix viminalis]